MLWHRWYTFADRGDLTTRVIATGTFDILHPGHLWYLEESAALGDELFVIVARDVNVHHKPKPVIPEAQRVKMVAALKPVDHALLGDETDMFLPIEQISPDIITLGFNQHFQEERLSKALRSRDLNPLIVRIKEYADAPFCSSRRIVSEVCRKKQN